MNSVFQSAGISLSGTQMKKLHAYYELLIERNKVMNLTAITDYDEVLARHFADSLAPVAGFGIADSLASAAGSGKADSLVPEAGNEIVDRFGADGIRIMDLGSGAGFPGVPLAIALPGAQITLADSLQKRCGFLCDVQSELNLQNIQVIHGRAEEIGHDPAQRESFDIVVSRAVADLRVLCEYCLPLVSPGGLFAAWKGPDVQEETENAGSAIALLGGENVKIYSYTLPDSAGERSMVFISKTTKTPEKYPRRAGIPTKRPL